MALASKASPLSSQITKLMLFLDEVDPHTVTDGTKTQILAWVRDLPQGMRPVELIRKVGRVFHLEEGEMEDLIDPGRKKLTEIDDLIPKSGWLRDYITYTRQTEPPTAYHFFAGAVAIASALARNVYYRGGHKDLYPNLWAVLVGPSGRVRKTTACNLALKLLNAAGINVLADKLTPEALVEAFKDSQSAIGLIHAPEFAVFLGKQKYQEGMIPMLTALSDCPDVWRSATIMRGGTELTNVGLTMLGASTLDWLQHAIPKDAFGGGFMSRILFVVQERTPRCFPDPPPLDKQLQTDLISRLRKMTLVRGEFVKTDAASKWWEKWYRHTTDRMSDNKHHAGYIARVPDQAWRLAMILAIAEGQTTGNLVIDVRHFETAAKLLDWVEAFLPSTFDQLSETAMGNEQMAIVSQLKKTAGKATHSELLRKNARRMNAEIFKRYIATLRDSGLVEYDSNEKVYFLTPEGWKQ